MNDMLHTFQIPVMGTGHSVDTPIRVAHLGISSVISLTDDLLLEPVCKYYCKEFSLPYEPASPDDPDARAKRTRTYLDAVHEIVNIKMARTRALPFFEENDKTRYFELLPDTAPLKQAYLDFINMPEGSQRDAAGEALTQRMLPGSIDVNIMVKLDKVNYDENGDPLGDEFTDARAALRGFALSKVEGSLVFSAGLNKGLFSYITQFKNFYRDETGTIRKRIVIKVSDFRSSLIQGRFLARKGLEVYEYRIESGLNCGGHAFATNGFLLPQLVQEFKEKKDQLATSFQKSIKSYYKKQGWAFTGPERPPLVTVQGGIGNFGEDERMRKSFDMDMTGWGSPFLLVAEATCVDDTTRNLLADARSKDLYLSHISPLGVPFNHVHNCGSEKWTRRKAASGKPGSACPKRFLISDKEFSDRPVCKASRLYQKQKLEQLAAMDISESEKTKKKDKILEKTCLCGHLSSGALISLGIVEEKDAPQLVCPGPNLEWFSKSYTLKEMVDHIYGRGESLVPAERPHMFAQELKMYVDYYEKQAEQWDGEEKSFKGLRDFKNNMEDGMALCLEIAAGKAYPGENLASIKSFVETEGKRLKDIYLRMKRRLTIKEVVCNGDVSEEKTGALETEPCEASA